MENHAQTNKNMMRTAVCFLLLAVGVCAGQVAAQKVPADTVWKKHSKDSLSYELYAGEAFRIPAQEFYMTFEVGATSWTGALPADFAIKPFNSGFYALAWHSRWRLGGEDSHHMFSLGVEAAWYNHVFEKDLHLEVQNETLTMQPLGLPLKRSKFTMFQGSLPFSYQWHGIDSDNNRRGWTVVLGGFVGYGLADYTKVVYEDANGYKRKEKRTGEYFTEPFRYGVTAALGKGDWLLFARYHLQPVFEANHGAPEVQTLVLGLRLQAQR
ncbi:MAG: hypothetical protein KatS3mg033_0524 [Thermonema sp.]|nr:MAG: hypothetical protein KatS3mg033_0524 [Thermonema sp.]